MLVVLHGLILFLSVLAPVFSNAQQDNFISIDCGTRGTSYTDEETGIFYSSDADYILTGENRDIAHNLLTKSTMKPFFRTVRTFPEGNRNCYTLKPVTKGSKYLVRAWFMYGNIDGTGEIPKFDVYVGANFWHSVDQNDAEEVIWIEIITISKNDFLSVCLVRRKGNGNPYISALELRPLEFDMYNVTTESLVLKERFDLGSATNKILRYKDDAYDRIWSPLNSNAWHALKSSRLPFLLYDYYKPPSIVMSTAVAPLNGSEALNFTWSADNPESEFYIFSHFAEIELLENGQVREFNTCVADYSFTCFGPFQPKYLYSITLIPHAPISGSKEYYTYFQRTAQSDLPPIVNAIEIYSVAKPSFTPTYEQDLEAIMEIGIEYGVKKNWMGDPCVPINYTWEGLTCSRDVAPRIISLNLSFSGLHGTISASIGKLTSLKSLDLSGNNLSGKVPSFLSGLTSLRLLNLSGNNFTGSIPSILLERSRGGILQLSIDGSGDSCNSNSCKSKKKSSSTIIIVAPVAAVVVVILAIIFGIWWKSKSRKIKREALIETSIIAKGIAPTVPPLSFKLDNRRFTYAELERITVNFNRVLGRGAFGVVYHGQLDDGTPIAVKMISHHCKGSTEFQIEAQLLTRVHHRNLVQFIGYCADDKNMALVLEFMSRGNLASVLFGSENNNNVILTWGQRLQIALDVAQGLEYLHFGCKPPVIHRDVKLSNILLNDKFEAKIADFGLSKVFGNNDGTHVTTLVKGTVGYLDPEYCVTNNLNEKSDVYSFGIVLLELITGKPAIFQVSSEERINISEWVDDHISCGDIRSIMDPRLGEEWDIKSAWTAINVATASSRPKCRQRPSMRDVVAELKDCFGGDKVSSRRRSFHHEEHDSILSTDSMF